MRKASPVKPVLTAKDDPRVDSRVLHQMYGMPETWVFAPPTLTKPTHAEVLEHAIEQTLGASFP